MVRRAIRFLVNNGPAGQQDRWEENAGFSPFTLAIEIVALIAGAAFLDDEERTYALSLADYWNERVEDWTYVSHGPLANEFGVDGHYVRIGPEASEGGLQGRVVVHNRPNETVPAAALVGMEYLNLVRLGLRAPDDPRIQNTLKITEALLKVETPYGIAYHRYNGDGYGEHEDGASFDGVGIGRAWPLLTGERGHLALQLGEDPLPYLEMMARMTGPGGLIPEQVWDSSPLMERGLESGKPSGSAMPLVWAHAEFLQLLYARQEMRPFEMLKSVEEHRRAKPHRRSVWHWRPETPFDVLPEGRDLLFDLPVPFLLHLGYDDWQKVEDRPSTLIAFGRQGVRLTKDELAHARVLDFTFYFASEGRWEGRDHHVQLAARTQSEQHHKLRKPRSRPALSLVDHAT